MATSGDPGGVTVTGIVVRGGDGVHRAPPASFVMRTVEPHAECLNGHRLDYAGVTHMFSHGLNTHATCCDLCAELHLDRHAWFAVDHTLVRRADEEVDPAVGIEFVIYPPEVPAGTGEIQLYFERKPVARVRLLMCRVERHGVLVHVEVKESYWRRRMASTLIACAVARGPRYHWSTVPVPNTAAVRAFCASMTTQRELHIGQPHYCSHMAHANPALG